MNSRLMILPLMAIAMIWSCVEEAGLSKDAASFDDDLVQGTDLGAADGYGPYQGLVEWDRAVGGQLDSFIWYHLWELRVEEGSTATINLSGEVGTDTYLMLYQWNGWNWERTATNDDCDYSTLDSCLDEELGSGDYLVLVSTYEALAFRWYLEAGYTLEINCDGGGCANNLCGTNGNADVPTQFLSADNSSSYGFGIRHFAEPVLETATEDSARVVEEGDIYRVLDTGTILNLNTYRGLQIIDVTDPTMPEIIGRSQVTGSPVELYVVDQTAYVLLNNYQGYYELANSARVDSYNGGLLVAVDLSDLTHPVVVDQARIPGNIKTSRLTRGGGQVALYAVSSEHGQFESDEWETRTVVSSFALSAGIIEPQNQLNLGGYVADIQATPDALLVARNNWQSQERFSRVAVIDISDPTGAIVEGPEVAVAGVVSSKTNMDIRNGILRVVSGSSWSGTTANHLQTFDATDPDRLSVIDACEFGEGQNLFATLFLEDRAFFVTYLRVDPFHAFSLTEDGHCEEVAEFEVSGWNNYFRPVFDDQRLIGIGINDENGRTLAVSLYDITNLANPQPMVARSEVEADRSWSEATWDDRAFSVLENAVAVETADGLETGLVLLPFSGWNEENHEYVSAVQIFTFSERALTRRGLMIHGTQVRRSFVANADTLANLSETELSLFEHGNPDQPQELGRVSLAPNFTDVLVFGEYGARLNRSSETYMGWWGNRAELPPSTVEIFDLSDHADTSVTLTEIQVPANAEIERVGRLLAIIDSKWVGHEDGPGNLVTRIEMFDLTVPTEPELLGAVGTDQLTSGGNWGGPIFNCFRWPCRPPMGSMSSRFVVGDALVFLQNTSQQEVIGEEETCWIRPVGDEFNGTMTCRTVDGGETTCYGEIRRCETTDDGLACEAVDPEEIETTEECHTNDLMRYWQSYTAHVLDLVTPTEPTFVDPIELPLEEQGVSALADGDQLWITVRRSEEVEGDSRAFARNFVRAFDLSTPTEPTLGEPINVPGELFAVDGPTIFTRDLIWGDEIAETAIAQSVVCDGLAYIQANHRFEDQDVEQTVLDGAGHVLASHRLSWQIEDDSNTRNPYLTVLGQDGLSYLGAYQLDDWANLRTARAGHALFEVPGGLLIVNTQIDWLPLAQAYFPVRGWPREFHLLEDERVILAAGRFGIYDFDFGLFNLW